MALCFGSAVAHAQTSGDPPLLFEEVTTSSSTAMSGDLSQLSHADLTQRVPALQGVTSQQFNALQNTPGAVNTRFVRIPIRNELDGLKAITVNVDGHRFTATLDRIDVVSEKEYAWVGTVRVGGEAYGEVTLMNRDGRIAGTVRLDDGFHYQVYGLDKNLYALAKIDLSKLPEETPGADVGAEAYSAAPSPESAAPQSTLAPEGFDESTAATTSSTVKETIRVLVLYTSEAANAVTNIQDVASMAIQQSNESYPASAIYNLSLQLAGTRQLSGFTQTASNIGSDLGEFTGSSQAQSLRSQYNADVVILLTDAGYFDPARPGSQIFGVADAVFATGTQGHAIVEVDFATSPRYTFPHEIGHLQGAWHHPDDNVGVPSRVASYAFGHRFTSRKKFIGITVRRRYHSTIMAYTPGDFARVNRWSNPSVEYNDVDTGTPTRNNARRLRETARSIASLVGPPGMAATVSYTNTGNHYTFRANTSGATGTLTYEWYRSLNSVGNYGGVVSRQQSYPTMIYPDNILYVKVIVRSSAGQVATAYGSAYSPPSDCDDPYPPCNQASVAENALEAAEGELTTAETNVPKAYVLHAAYPNPFNPSTEIRFDLPEASDVRLAVYDVTGREVTRLADGPMGAGSHRVRFEAAGLPSGVYLYRLEAGAFAATERMTLVK